MTDKILWVLAIIGTAADVLLLLRVLGLRLHRMYLFVTLFCVVSVFIDGAEWLVGWESAVSARIEIYSKFVLALVFPLAVFDVFEGLGTKVRELRRLHTMRLILGMIVTVLFAFVLSLNVDDQDLGMIGAVALSTALLIAATTATTCGLFLWNMRRSLKKESLAIPSNTQVLWILFLVTLAGEFIGALLQMAGGVINKQVWDAVVMLLGTVQIGVIGWCVWKLQGIPAPGPQSEEIAKPG